MQNCEKQEYFNTFYSPGLKMFQPSCACNPPYPYLDMNIVKDYRTLENQQDPGQVSIRQNVNTRHVRLENNSKKSYLIGINLYNYFPYRPKPQFLLRGGEVRDLAVNMPGQKMQYIWTYDPVTNRVTGDPHTMRQNINTYVLNEGENRTWIHDFYHKGYRGQI